MSTYWGLHCATCNVSTAHVWNHGSEELAAIVLHVYPRIHGLIDELRHLPAFAHLDVYGMVQNWSDEPHIFDWLAQHQGHDLMIESEYGQRLAPKEGLSRWKEIPAWRNPRAGEYYPCKPDIFEATYEPVE